MITGQEWDKGKVTGLFSQLGSPNWTTRAQAMDELSLLRDHGSLKNLFEILKNEQDDSYCFATFSLVENLLSENDYQKAGLAIFCLSNFSTRKNKKIKERSKDLIYQFYANDAIFHYLKVLSFREAWKLLGTENRYLMTKVAGTFALIDVTPLILENLIEKDRSLVSLTIKVLKKFDDSRGNRLLKGLLKQDQDEELKIEIIGALGVLGNFFDGFYLKEFLNDSSLEVRKQTIESLVLLWGNFSFKTLKEVFLRSDEKILRSEIIRQLSKLDSKKICYFLVEQFLENDKTSNYLNIEWALHGLPNNILVPILIEKFHQSDGLIQYKILNFFNEISDRRSLVLLKEVITGEYSDLLKIAAFEAVAHYDDQEVKLELENQFNETGNPLAYHALNSLFAHPSLDAKKIIHQYIKQNLPASSLIHNIVLTYLRERNSDLSDDRLVIDHINHIIASMDSNNQFLGVLAAARYSDQDTFKLLCDLLRDHPNEFLEGPLIRSIIKIFSRKPEYLDNHFEILNHPKIIANFKMERLKRPLILKICQLAVRLGFEHFIAFFEANGKYFAENLELYITRFDDQEFLEVVLVVLLSHGISLSPISLDYLVNQVFDDANKHLQFLILRTLANWPSETYTDFMITKTRLLEQDYQNCRGLMTEFVANLP